MAISEKIKWDFSQLKTGLIAFMTDIEKKIHELVPDIPVFVLQTGDTSYYTDLKFQEIQDKEIYQKVPRFTLTFDDIQYQTDQYTNQYNILEYKYKNKIYSCKARRLSTLVPINTNFVLPNFLFALEYYEIFSTILTRPNVFTYDFQGNTYEVAYQFQSNNSSEIPTFDYSNQSKNFVIKFGLTLELQLLIPRVETINEIVLPEDIKTKSSIKSRATIDNSQNLET